MFKWLTLSFVIIILDQITKLYAVQELILYQPVNIIPGLNLTLMHNTGAAFSFLSHAGGWQRWFFIGLGSLISIAIIIWMYGVPSSRRWLLTALTCVLGGALANLWDRVTLGYVIDFIEVYYQDLYWPAFNVADSAITIGAIMLVIDVLLFDDTEIEI